MARGAQYASELTLVRNIIDYNCSEPVTPRSVVEMWADHLVNMCNNSLDADFVESPIDFMLTVLQTATANTVLHDLEEWTSTSASAFTKLAFLGFCEEKFNAGGGVQVNSPDTFVKTEMFSALRQMAYLIESNAG